MLQKDWGGGVGVGVGGAVYIRICPKQGTSYIHVAMTLDTAVVRVPYLS